MPQESAIAAFEKRKRAMFEAALALNEVDSAAFLAEMARVEPDVAQAVRRLLTASSADKSSVLSRPVYERPHQGRHPSSIGRYVVLKHLGDGGMGSVYLCENPGSQTPVAVKIVRSNLRSLAVRNHFERERDILKQLSHPNVCRLLDASVAEGDIPFIVMEWIRGEHLGNYCGRTACSLERRLLLFSQVLAGVEYFHSRNIIHRDLKPSNLFVTPEGTVKTLDFGLARMIEHEKGRTGLGPTGTNSRFMTVAYASPEQLTGRLSGRSSDIYSLGVIFYELLTGQHPFSPKARQSAQSLYQALSTAAPPPPSEKVRSLPRVVDNLVMNALQAKPQDRYESVAAFLLDVRKCLDGHAVESRVSIRASGAGK